MTAAARLHHVTSTTGHVARTARAGVADSVVALLRPLVAAGGQVPTVPEWHLDVWRPADPQTGQPVPGSAAFQVARGPASSEAGKRPYVLGVACWRTEAAAEAWEQAHRMAALAFPAAAPDLLPAEPPPVPWLSVTPGVGIALLPRERVGVLGDFERCVAWTMIELWP